MSRINARCNKVVHKNILCHPSPSSSSSHVAKLIIYFEQKSGGGNETERKSFPFFMSFRIYIYMLMQGSPGNIAKRAHLKLLEIFMVRRFSEWEEKEIKCTCVCDEKNSFYIKI